MATKIVFVGLNTTRNSRSQLPSGLRRVSTADRLLGLRVRISPEAWMFVLCVLSGSLCDGLITRPECGVSFCVI